MALPAPNLDDRHFQDLVDEAKRSISHRCPEWTDHNVSDPGVTLIELFASMTETILYRLNQVPEKNYLKFLEMIGIHLQPGAAARTGITFPLAPGWPGDRVMVPAGTEISTEPAGDEDPIVFSTDRELVLATPGIAYVVNQSIEATSSWNRSGAFLIWGRYRDPNAADPADRDPTPPAPGDALYLGFDRDITGYLLQVEAGCVRGAAAGMNPDNSLGVWEFYNTSSGAWQELEVESDTTRGLDGALGGPSSILFRIPWENFDERERKIDDKPAWWIRYRYAPPPGRETEYEAAPVITDLECRLLAGSVSASHAVRVRNEPLGLSDGTPGQVFRLPNAPILQLEPGEGVEVEMLDGGWEPWLRREDFSDSGAADKHCVIDTETGEVRFGPELQLPTGRGPVGGKEQKGAIPPIDRRILFSGYRFGGGTIGNVPANTLTNLRRTISYVVNSDANPLLRITNRERAVGGSNREELAHAKLRGQRKLRSLTRAVTAEDFEYHAQQAQPNAVERVRCIAPVYPGRERRGQRTPPPGEVRVLVIPAVAGDAARLSFEDQLRVPEPLANTIQSYLEQRKLITTQVTVAAPQYYRISTDVAIRVDPRHTAERVRQSVERALHSYVNPLIGGPAGSGWPFEYPLRLVDLRAVVQAVDGVRYLDSIRVYYRRAEGEARVQMRGQNAEVLELPLDALVLSEQHLVRVSG